MRAADQLVVGRRSFKTVIVLGLPKGLIFGKVCLSGPL